jgi:polar amino acid transport system ATP-binding protein
MDRKEDYRMKIHIKDLVHRYDIEVLSNLSFDLDGYNSVAIIGASGSGKSTLLRILSSLEKPTEGEVTMNGMHIDSKDYRKKIGFVFQNHNLFPHLTLERNISLILEKTRGYGKVEARQTAIKYLTMVQLEDQLNKFPNNVSGGQAQRASIARALSLDPDLIFMDEPTSSLDPVLTYEVLSGVKALRGLGKNFIFVTHVITFVKEFADYVIFMDKGLIVEHGPPSILTSPATEALKRYISYI